jgi:hypothetical protein
MRANRTVKAECMRIRIRSLVSCSTAQIKYPFLRTEMILLVQIQI